MRVKILNTADGGGGAAKAAFRLNAGLRASGVESTLVTPYPVTGAEGVEKFPCAGGPFKSIARAAGKVRERLLDRRLRGTRPEGAEIFSMDRSPFAGDIKGWRPDCDVINLHWVARFVDMEAFFEHHSELPVVWTLHDMNPFTGGCHYDSGCGRYVESCGRCPDLGSDKMDDLSAVVFARKKGIFDDLADDALHFVTPSRWLAGEAARSALIGRFPVSVIPNGIDTKIFRPDEGRVKREELGISENAKVILFTAHSLDAKRKGFSFLIDAFREISARSPDGVLLLSAGDDRPDLGGGLNHRHLDFVEDEAAMAGVYAAADVLALPSLQDNLPNNMIEAMVCGTPVVAFDAGGISEFVRPGETGFLAPVGDSGALAAALLDAFSDKDRLSRMSVQCRDLVVAECSLGVQAERYKGLFESLIGKG